jgi:hypothetical protein
MDRIHRIEMFESSGFPDRRPVWHRPAKRTLISLEFIFRESSVQQCRSFATPHARRSGIGFTGCRQFWDWLQFLAMPREPVEARYLRGQLPRIASVRRAASSSRVAPVSGTCCSSRHQRGGPYVFGTLYRGKVSGRWMDAQPCRVAFSAPPCSAPTNSWLSCGTN